MNAHDINNLPVLDGLETGYGLRAPIPHVLSLEIESYEQHVFVHGASTFYIKGKLRGGHVTLKKYRWELKKEKQHEMFQNEETVLRQE